MKLFSLLDYQLKISLRAGDLGFPAIMRMKGSFPETSTSPSQNLAHLMDKVIPVEFFSRFKTTGFSDVSTGGLPLRVLGFLDGLVVCLPEKITRSLKANQLQPPKRHPFFSRFVSLHVALRSCTVSLRGPDKNYRKNKPLKKDCYVNS